MHNRFFITSLCFLAFSLTDIYADIPENYYNTIEGLRKEKLKTGLHKIIKDANVPKYGSGANSTWEAFTKTDVDSDGTVLDRYSISSYNFNGIGSVDGMHIEHSFANSWWGGIKNNAYKDLHHLYPSQGSANISKSNHVMAVVDGSTTLDNGRIKVGKSSSRPGGTITAWEPCDEFKGDFARTYLYMVTCYEDFDEIWKSDGLNMLDNNKYPVFEPWAVKLLLEWNELDPVDEREKNRNEEVYKIQGNRNPFIDYPQLVSHIWGNDSTNLFYTNPDLSSATIFTPYNSEIIDVKYLETGIDNDIEVIIRGKNISEELSIEKSATWIISDITSIASTDIEDGTIINFKLNRNETGDFNEKILLKSDNFFSEFYLRGNFYNIVKGLPATDIYSYEYKKAFTANWSCNYPVSIDVYTKNDDVKISVAGFPKDNISENSLEISSLNANTTYYYQLTANDVTSEEIAVTLPSITPTISFDYDEINFTTVPNRVSFAKLVSFKTTGLNDNIVCSTVAPFELSIDNKEWSHDINVPYTNGGFYIRLGNCDIEEELETELFISHESIEDDIIINLKGDVNREKSFVEGFEFGIKGSYAVADVYCDDARWRMTSALIGTLDNDQKNGKRSVRLHLNSSIPGVVELLDEKTNGIDSISFFAGTYGTDAAGDLSLEYTQDNGVTWKPIVSNLTMTKVWTRYSYYVGVNGNVRIRFTKDSKSRRVNLDDIIMSDYAVASSLSGLNSEKESISIYGNNVVVSNDDGCEISIFNLQGMKLYDYSSDETTVSVSLDKGMYIIKGRYTTKFVLIK